jgi:hypothetical protein
VFCTLSLFCYGVGALFLLCWCVLVHFNQLWRTVLHERLCYKESNTRTYIHQHVHYICTNMCMYTKVSIKEYILTWMVAYTYI